MTMGILLSISFKCAIFQIIVQILEIVSAMNYFVKSSSQVDGLYQELAPVHTFSSTAMFYASPFSLLFF